MPNTADNGFTRLGNDPKAGDGLPIHPRDSPQISTAVAAHQKNEKEEELMSSMYLDAEVDSALRQIDSALLRCHSDHEEDTAELCSQSHKAVNTVRKFREEVLAKTKQVLGEGDMDLLVPGDGPKALLGALACVLEYTHANSRVAVGAARFLQMKDYSEISGRQPVRGQNGAEDETERCSQEVTIGTSLQAQRRRPSGPPRNFHQLEDQLKRAVRLHLEHVVETAEVRLAEPMSVVVIVCVAMTYM